MELNWLRLEGSIRRASRLLGLVILAFTLLACTSSSRAPVEYRIKPGYSPPSHYFVASGDTLFKIAWRFGMDYKELARINDIAAPYTIYPGQKLIFKAPVVAKPRERAAPTSPVTKPVVQPSTKPRVAVKEEPPMPAFTGRWRWPAPGKIIRAYSGAVHKGIDIVGERGDPVVAVADGKVVYAGTGISGYGRLLIVKHDETYLSAYGHNDTLLVSEGDAVKGGQSIARMGDSGPDSVKLHFEMRRNGKPIDPQSLLGKR